MESTRIKVLLIDDHPVVRNGVRLMLGTAEDIEVAGEAESARDAVSLARQVSADVCLLDIALPDRTGLELLKVLKTQKPAMAVLMLSIYAEKVYAQRAIKSGASGYLTKNSPAETLIEAIRAAHRGEKVANAVAAEQFHNEDSDTDAEYHNDLSDRELEVLKLLAAGESLVRIAEKLHLSPKTVTTYRTRISQKLNLKSTAALTRYALEHGLLL